MAESKSTDKLDIIKDIISNLRHSLDDEQLGRLKEINLDWKAIQIDQFDSMPCPILNIKLYAKDELKKNNKDDNIILKKG